jgi:hypothetical protein
LLFLKKLKTAYFFFLGAPLLEVFFAVVVFLVVVFLAAVFFAGAFAFVAILPP